MSLNSFGEINPHLKSAIKKLAEASFEKKLVVDAVNGPYFTISSAIEAAEGKTTILVNRGLYIERIRITKPDIKIVPFNKEASNELIILNDEGPTIDIDIPDNGRCEITNFKVTHSAKVEEVEDIKKEGQKLNMISALIGNDDGEVPIDDENDSNGWTSSQIDTSRENMVCLVRIRGGRLSMKDCVLSLGFLKRSTEYSIPAVIVRGSKSEGTLKNCFIRGNHMHPTLGIYVENADCFVENCVINNHLAGGIFLNNSFDQNLVKVSRCKFYDNKGPYVEIIGRNNFALIENNFF